MIFKTNKENSKTQRAWALAYPPTPIDSKHRQQGNTTFLNLTLHSNNKIFKMRRNSNFNSNLIQNFNSVSSTHPKLHDLSQLDNFPLDTVYAKRISLCDNRQRNKNLGKNCRSASHNYERSVLQQSNFDLLKQQARKLEQEQSFCALYRWRPSITKPSQAQKPPQQQPNSLLLSIKKSKKSNMRKIVKGRPQIKRLLQQNRERLLKQKTIEYNDYIQTQQPEQSEHMQNKYHTHLNLNLNLNGNLNGNGNGNGNSKSHHGTPQCVLKNREDSGDDEYQSVLHTIL